MKHEHVRHAGATGAQEKTALLADRPRLLMLVLIALFVLAAGVRLVALDAVGISPDRDFTSAIFARDFYFQRAGDIEPWRRDVAHATRENQPALEPPLTEWMVSVMYSVAGAEDPRLGRLLTSAFWILAGWFLYLIVKRLVSTDAAVLALGYYLFLPQGILLSRSVQPDALMMLGFMASLYLVLCYHERSSPRLFAVAGILSAATVLYRPLVLPALVAAFAVPVAGRRGVLRAMRDTPTIIYAVASALPAVLYYGYATVVARSFGWKLTTSFRFDLWLQPEFWKGWLELAVWVVGLAPLVLATCGIVLLREGLARSFVIGLVLGYLAFGLLFTMHIHTHHYYQAQLIPIVAIAASPVAALLAERVASASGQVIKVICILAMGALVGLPAVREWREGLQAARNEAPTIAREIGHIVGHSQRVVTVSPHYGLGLQYLGELTGTYWPRRINYWLYRDPGERELSVGERLSALKFEPEYFVITAFSQYESHHRDLADYLESRCSLKAKSPDYLIYEACMPPDAGRTTTPPAVEEASAAS